jgi:hypothetical protein
MKISKNIMSEVSEESEFVEKIKDLIKSGIEENL